MNKYLVIFAKSIIALLLAFVFMHYFCYFYFNTPTHYDNSSGATDYIWEKNKFYSKMTEGFGNGKTNNEGFNNIKEYRQNDNIDILLMGSSHMEAFQVLQDENTASFLNKIFSEQLYTYNIGISGHTLPICVSNLKKAIEYYRPQKYIIIETSNVLFEENCLRDCLNNSLKPASNTARGINYILQKNKFFRLVYTNFKTLFTAKNNNLNNKLVYTQDVIDLTSNMLGIINTQSKKNNIIPIIVFHKPLNITNKDEDSDINNDENIKTFNELCNKNNIIFVDMTPVFLKNYKNKKVFPYGFSNTTPNTGHLNKNGHRMIAEELYRTISNLEERKNGIQ